MARILKWTGIIAACLVVLFVAAGIYGSRPGGFNGSNTRLYEAVSVYSVGITNDEADKIVDQIAQQASLSHSDAQDMAVSFARTHAAPSTWPSMAIAAKGMAKLKHDGVID
jgi:hypothetical protein